MDYEYSRCEYFWQATLMHILNPFFFLLVLSSNNMLHTNVCVCATYIFVNDNNDRGNKEVNHKKMYNPTF